MRKLINTDSNKLTEPIIGAAIEVHRESGTGLLESAYQSAFFMNLRGAVSFLRNRNWAGFATKT